MRWRESRKASVPPWRVVESAPERFPKRRQSSIPAPRINRCRKPASKLSPAPIVSTVSVTGGEASKRLLPWRARTPFSPRFMTSKGTFLARMSAARRGSSSRARRQASCSFGRRTSTNFRVSAVSSCQRSSGSSLVSRDVVRPACLARRNSSAIRGRRARCRK